MVAALGELKRYMYVCLFQCVDTNIFQLHDQQLEMFKNFLSNYIKSEHLAGKSAENLKQMNISAERGVSGEWLH